MTRQQRQNGCSFALQRIAIRLDYRPTSRRAGRGDAISVARPRSRRATVDQQKTTTTTTATARRPSVRPAAAAAVPLIYRVIGALSGRPAGRATPPRTTLCDSQSFVALRLLAAGHSSVAVSAARRADRSVFHPINVHYGSPSGHAGRPAINQRRRGRAAGHSPRTNRRRSTTAASSRRRRRRQRAVGECRAFNARFDKCPADRGRTASRRAGVRPRRTGPGELYTAESVCRRR